MLNPFGRLTCIAALAGAALAQSIAIVYPESGTTLVAGEPFNITLESELSSNPLNDNPIVEYGLLIGMSACPGGVCGDDPILGPIVYNKVYSSTYGTRENISVVATRNFNGLGRIKLARFFTKGAYNTPELQNANVTIIIKGASG